MDKIDIILSVVSGGFSLMLVMWHFINRRIERLSDKVDDIDKRLCGIEGSLATQGHCLFHNIKEDRKIE